MKPLNITEHDLNTPGLEHTTYESDTSITFTFTLHKGTGTLLILMFLAGLTDLPASDEDLTMLAELITQREQQLKETA